MPSAWATARARSRASCATIGPDRRGHERRVEDVALVAVEGDRIADGPAVDAASHDDRELRGEVDPALGDTGRPGPGWPTRRAPAAAVVDQDLSLAVIARGGRLEDQRQTEARATAMSSSASLRTGRQGACGMSCRARNRFSRSRFWQIQSVRQPGRTDPPARQPAQRRGRDVFELDGDRLGPLGKRSQAPADDREDRSPSSGPPARRGLFGRRSARRRDSPSAAPPG